MDYLKNASLADYSTMGLGGKADYLASVKNKEELEEAILWAENQKMPVIMIGGGSNIVWTDEGFSGLVILNKITGFNEHALSNTEHEITIGAGENWDKVVGKTTSLGLSGIECLSLVPGLAGATPVQNVGAYGQEIADVLISLEAYDKTNHKFITLKKSDCDFSYRNSRFKKSPGLFYITSIKLKLVKKHIEPPFYGALDNYLNEHAVTDYSPSSIREAVINIRSSKLPDPAKVKNCGSFFANPIIDSERLTELELSYPGIPYWETGNAKIKLSAAWLIDQGGFSNYHDKETGMATWPKQPLVLINESAKSTNDLLNFKQKIIDAVKSKFGIELVQEPELLP